MPLLNKRSFQKREPWRDATLFIIICEGSETEPAYFDFFDRLTSKIKVFAIPSQEGRSSPKHLVINAKEAVQQFNSDAGDYELWIVLDLDRWLEHRHIYALQSECKEQNWKVVISNPCFEVWLNNHFSSDSPQSNMDKCQSWKRHLHKKCGGFNSTKHPSLIATAIKNSQTNFNETGYIPAQGCTQVFKLGEKIYALTVRELEKYYL